MCSRRRMTSSSFLRTALGCSRQQFVADPLDFSQTGFAYFPFFYYQRFSTSPIPRFSLLRSVEVRLRMVSVRLIRRSLASRRLTSSVTTTGIFRWRKSPPRRPRPPKPIRGRQMILDSVPTAHLCCRLSSRHSPPRHSTPFFVADVVSSVAQALLLIL